MRLTCESVDQVEGLPSPVWVGPHLIHGRAAETKKLGEGEFLSLPGCLQAGTLSSAFRPRLRPECTPSALLGVQLAHGSNRKASLGQTELYSHLL